MQIEPQGAAGAAGAGSQNQIQSVPTGHQSDGDNLALRAMGAADFQSDNDEVDDSGDGMDIEANIPQAGKGVAANVEMNRGQHWGDDKSDTEEGEVPEERGQENMQTCEDRETGTNRVPEDRETWEHRVQQEGETSGEMMQEDTETGGKGKETKGRQAGNQARGMLREYGMGITADAGSYSYSRPIGQERNNLETTTQESSSLQRYAAI